MGRQNIILFLVSIVSLFSGALLLLANARNFSSFAILCAVQFGVICAAWFVVDPMT
jgi:hypothetical protein